MEFSTNLTDAVLKDAGFGEAVLRTIIIGPADHENVLANLIRDEAKGAHDFTKAIPLAIEIRNKTKEKLCNAFAQPPGPHIPLSALNRAFTRQLCPYPHPNRATMYQQVKIVCETNRDKLKTVLGDPICDEQIHLICQNLARYHWEVHPKSLIFLQAYKLWYFTYKHEASVDVHCAAEPDIPDHWIHHPSISTPI
jgi:hypothetical protein